MKFFMTENEKNLRKNIGKKIKLARTKTNYTQEALAEKTSLSPRYISQLERGIAFGSASTIVNLCNALNISSDFLFNDLIDSTSPDFTDSIDNKFLEDYYQLNDYNKKILSRLANDLVKLQLEDGFKKRNIKYIFYSIRIFRCSQISNTCRNALKNLIQHLASRTYDKIIIRVDTHADNSDKRRYQQIVCVVHNHIANLVHHHCPDIAINALFFFPTHFFMARFLQI